MIGARRLLLGLVPLLSVLVGVLALCSAASAGVAHEYLPVPSEELAKGVPVGCVVFPEPLLKEPPCIPGVLQAPSAEAVSNGKLWLADSHRVDAFNAKTGAFVGPQLDEEGGARGLGGALAVGHAFSGEQVYVQSSGGVAVFDGATGKLVGSWNGVHTPFGSFGGERGVAVDASASMSDGAKGDVYVTSTSIEHEQGDVVDVFDPEKEATKAGEEPVKPVTVIEGTCEAPGEVATGSEACHESHLVRFHFPLHVAVSPLNGDLFVGDNVEFDARYVVDVFAPSELPGGPYKFLSTIGEANGAHFHQITGLAVDGGGDLYVALGGGNGNMPPNVVYQFAAGGEFLSRLEGTPTERFGEQVQSIAADPESGDLFVGAGGSSVPVGVFGPTITIPDVAVTKTEPSEVHATNVTLNGTVKLDKAGSAECFFDYGTTASYGQSVPCKPASVTEVEEEKLGKPVPVEATLIGLQPDTTYFYRVRALNGSRLASKEDHGQLTTSGPGLHGEFSSEVASTAATLGATIDPHGSNTSYYLQYVNPAGEGIPSTDVCPPTGLASCPVVPVPPGEALGSAPGDQRVSQRVQGLTPGATYHYRVVVVSGQESGKTEEFPEADQTFTTQPAPTGFNLPDGRQWELVSPPDKHGARLLEIFEGVVQSSQSGDAFTDLASNPTEEGAPGYFDEEQILFTRGPSGWSSQDISLPHNPPVDLSVGNGQEYRFFSEDLSLGLAESLGEFTSLKPFVFPADTERTPYLRHNLACSSTPATCYEPLVTGAPGYADVPEGTSFGGPPSTVVGAVRFEGATPDLAHVVVRDEEPNRSLKAGVPGGALYEWSAGKPASEELQLVSVLPDGTPVVGEVGRSARWAVSADGSRVVWHSETQGSKGLYLTDMESGRSVRLDVPEGRCMAEKGCGDGAVAPEFQVADREDSRVFFTDSQQLVEGAGSGDLYECEVTVEASEPKCVLRDVAPGVAVFGGVLGASEDGSYVYFAASNLNLYMVHYDVTARSWEAPVLIAALSSDDAPDWGGVGAYRQTSRVSSNGGWLAFMSDRSLTGYDNRDAHSGKPDEEVFLYDAAHKRLVCASCNPTGARPQGIELVELGAGRLVNGPNVWRAAEKNEPGTGTWLAANIPSWTPFESGNTRYQSRYLSDEGRLFFNSSDALVPQDVNNNEDVYQWEPEGVGSCSSGSAGFSGMTGGCVGLISSGTSREESVFLDASESGSDVFFLTAEALVAQDTDTAYDVYDAHVCLAASPCSSAAVSPPPCTTADACRAAPAPVPEVFGAPASGTFSGPGNLGPRSPAKLVTKKAAKCKKPFIKNQKGRCVGRGKSKRKAGKSNRRGK
jgi:hypothetical protein